MVHRGWCRWCGDGPASFGLLNQVLGNLESSNGKTTELLQRIDGSLAQLADSLERGESAQLAAFLTYLSRFHRYSFGNVMLIALQRPDATQVAGFYAWKQLGRHVKKGERGIAILAPIIHRKKTAEEAGESESSDEEPRARAVGYRAVHVFDVSQTEGDPVPEFARVDGDPAGYSDTIRGKIRAAGINLKTEPIAGGADGVSRGGEIVVRSELTPAVEFSVLVHEYAHELLHRGPRRSETTKTIRETEAEAVAFVVSDAIGLETGTASSDYIQLYNGSRETLQESLKHIRECAARILGEILDDPGG